ncbi:hypothetical protein [Arthrobacter sp. FB24]|uniref:hypothetical protein n=1 Tax=Arthrobacter sp. (strain FB24) TaxID=290399 RepID=UPI001E3DA5EA|nr:hypothetical protein [Arthrobacter sp. FB24]
MGDGNRLGDVPDGAGSAGGAPAVALGGAAVPVADAVAVPAAVPLAVPVDAALAESLDSVAAADPGPGGAGDGPQAARSTARQAPAAAVARERAGPDDP